jgi:dimethylargininase
LVGESTSCILIFAPAFDDGLALPHVALSHFVVKPWMMSKLYGVNSMVAPLKRVVVKRPDKQFAVKDFEKWHYTSAPNLEHAQAHHDSFTNILKQHGSEVIYHDEEIKGKADALFVYDPVFVTPYGSIVMQVGKPLREGEEEPLARKLESVGVPILGKLTGNARAEGGDMFWLDETTLAIGLGFRTNAEGVAQIKGMLEPHGINIITTELPYGDGPAACLHLMSLISLVDTDLAVVYPKYIATPFWQELEKRNFKFITVSDQEFLTQATNVLTLSPQVVIMPENNPEAKGRLEQAGCTVYTYPCSELTFKAEGGPTCLTRPVLRE